jgi:hypothetical protein
MDNEQKTETKLEINFSHWLKHDALRIFEVNLLAQNIDPISLEALKFKFLPFGGFKELIISGVKCGEITSFPDDYVAPIESFLYLKKKGIQLPEKLDLILENEIDSVSLSKKIGRNKASYQAKDIRENELGLIAVLRTLLDLYPEYPKEKLIQLKPVQEYAKGDLRSEQLLKKMIVTIEGQKRAKGNVNKEKVKTIEKNIPEHWKAETSSQGY